jgi:hypothetical protein
VIPYRRYSNSIPSGLGSKARRADINIERQLKSRITPNGGHHMEFLNHKIQIDIFLQKQYRIFLEMINTPAGTFF